MCVDLCEDQVKEIKANKEKAAQQDMDAYEYWRTKKIAESCHWKFGKRGLH